MTLPERQKAWHDKSIVNRDVRIRDWNGRRSGWRTVERIYGDILGGIRLSRPAHGFVSWNVADICEVRK